ncbi:MAG: M23 family metallopeptidase [Epsilonproteobacteria bacterium]|nr:M23 family metallopeptidase [Campylobacterota bacterium]
MKKAILIIVLILSFLDAAFLEKVKWKKDQTLLGFLQENNISTSLYYTLDKEDKELASEIREGTTIEILRDEYTGEIEQILIPVTEELQIHIHKNANKKFAFEMIPIKYEKRKNTLRIDLTKSIYQDIVDKTKSHALAKEFLDAFKKRIDFKKLKKGDKVVIIYEQKYRVGERFGLPVIKAAMVEHRGKEYFSFLAPDGKYYDEKGKMRIGDSFIVPCRYKRISSRFTRKRWHPILHRYRAHLGIDYAAPRGTPVKAAYSGRVIFRGRKGGYGNVIEIAHPNGYKTLYAHLSGFKRGLKRNQRVKKGQIIGYVGSTGISTGPHLHFGLYFNNRPINPARKIVIANKIETKKRREFLKLVKIYKNEIKKALQREVIALNDYQSE